MKQSIPVVFALALLLLGAGCTDTPDGNLSVNETPATTLSYESGNLPISIDISQIEVEDPDNFTANVTSVIAVLLGDPRTGILLENGWNITSVSGATDEDDPDRRYIDVEFEREGLSFFIGVDEREGHTIGGYCDAEVWVAEPVSGPRPGDYHQAKDKMEGWRHVFDDRNEKVVMIYNSTTIFYLYPSYSIINAEGLND